MQVIKPTLLLDTIRAKRNIERMVKKANQSGVRFRPHCKTHQSARVGEWFRHFGVTAITVSSLDMAWYFAQHGWKDITIAFPVNLLQIDKINALAEDITLHLLVESVEVIHFLEKHLSNPVHVWIKIDAGHKRTGVAWNDFDTLTTLARHIQQTTKLILCGLLTHAAHTYHARSIREIRMIHAESVSRMGAVRQFLESSGFKDLEISVGDTPSCSVVDDLSAVDEIRPGNFVFYDVMQLHLGACSEDDLAVAVACPVVAKHRDRHEIVLYGGAIHLSKEHIMHTFKGKQMFPLYGYVALPLFQQADSQQPSGWGKMLEHTAVTELSQEHSIVKTEPDLFDQVAIGDLLIVLPVHACLTANLLRHYLTLEGETIELATFT
jgi:D-serine deaminase-like pyridoxal phosphate-dependent protein